MSEFGYHTIGGSVAAFLSHRTYLTKFTLSEDATVTSISAYLDGLKASGAGTQKCKLLIYDDDGGSPSKPNRLKATGAEITITAGDAAGWKTGNVSPSVVLAAGTYWVGLIMSLPSNLPPADFYIDSTGVDSHNTGTTYTSGPIDPWVQSGAQTTNKISIYVTYTPAGLTVDGISATSSMSARVQRAVVPAAVSATSSMSAAVAANRTVVTGTISATSPMVISAVGRVRPFTRFSINFGNALIITSSMTVSIARVRQLAASITASSAVAASVGRVRTLAVAIAATSVVVAALQRLRVRAMGPDAITATSDVVIQGAPPITLRATSNMGVYFYKVRGVANAAIAATSTSAASINRFRGLFPPMLSRSDMVAAIGRVRPVVAAVTATSNLVAGVVRGRQFFPSFSSHSDIVTSLVRLRQLAPALTASSIVTMAPARLRAFLAAISATSDVVAEIGAFRYTPVDSLVATSDVSASVGRIRSLVADVVATSDVGASVYHVFSMVADLTARSDMTAYVVREGALTPILQSTSNVTATVQRLRDVVPMIVATSDVGGSIVQAHGILPSIAATSPIDAPIVRERSLSTTISANSPVTAGLVRQRGFAPLATATSDVAASLIFTRAVAPAIIGSSDVAVVLGLVTTYPLTSRTAPMLLGVSLEAGELLAVEGV